jgi:hypothetical protein
VLYFSRINKGEGGLAMDEARLKALKQEILDLPEGEQQQIAQELLPLLLTTRAGVQSIDRVLQALSDQELDALVERARRRSQDVPEETVAAVIGEALRTVRAQSRP